MNTFIRQNTGYNTGLIRFLISAPYMNTFIRQNTGYKETEIQIYTTLSQDNIIFKSTPDTPIYCLLVYSVSFPTYHFCLHFFLTYLLPSYLFR